MLGSNFVQLIGHLGKDPEIRKFENGKVAVRFSMATNRSYTDGSGERVKVTTWHNVKAWGGLADRMFESLRKGSGVLIQGRLEVDEWEVDGEKKRAYYVLAQYMYQTDKQKEGGGWATPPPGVNATPKVPKAETPDLSGVGSVDNSDDDLPF